MGKHAFDRTNISAAKPDKWTSSFHYKSKVDIFQSAVAKNPWESVPATATMWKASCTLDTAKMPSLWEVAMMAKEKDKTSPVDCRDDTAAVFLNNERAGSLDEAESLIYSDRLGASASVDDDKATLSTSIVLSPEDDDGTDYSTDVDEDSEIYSIPESIQEASVDVSILTEEDDEIDESDGGSVYEHFDDLSVLTEDSGFQALGQGENRLGWTFLEIPEALESHEDTTATRPPADALGDVMLLHFVVGLCVSQPS